MQLRYYQALMVDAAEAAIKSNRSTMIHGATGVGKTIVLVSLASRDVKRGGRVLVLAHRIDLVSQAAKSLSSVGLDVGIEQGSNRSDGMEDVVCASVSTMRGNRLSSFAQDEYSMIIVDEAHHGSSKSYVSILDHFRSSKVIGVTATPWREDGRGLAEVFGSICFSYPIRRAISEGYLVPIIARRVTIKSIDLDGVRITAGDFSAKHLDDAYCSDEAVASVVDPLIEMSGDRSTIVFCAGVEHGRLVANEINNRHGSDDHAMMLSADNTQDERMVAIDGFLSGRVKYLVNVGLFTEGTDLPICSCVAIARPTKSRTLYSQMVGRGTRLASGSSNAEESSRMGKPDCLVIDLFGATTKHRLSGCVSILSSDDIPQDLVDEANALIANDQMSVDDAISMAKPIVEKRRAARNTEIVVEYLAEYVDPFVGRVIGPDPGGRPATNVEIDQIESLGFVRSKIPEGITSNQVKGIIDASVDRERDGLCTVRQGILISRRGIDPSGVTKQCASEMISHLATHSWRSTRSDLMAIRMKHEKRRKG